MKLYVKQYLILLFVATAFVSCQLPVDDDNGGGDDDNNSAHYKGPFSKLALDFDEDRAIDLESYFIDDTTVGGIKAQGFGIRLAEDVHLLAGAPLQTFAYTPFGGPRLLGKEAGYMIERGFTQEIRPEDYWYGRELFALGNQVDKDTGEMSEMFGDMVADDTRYWCMIITSDGMQQYGWIEYKCDGQAYLNSDGNWDTDIEVTDIFISEIPNQGIIAGKK